MSILYVQYIGRSKPRRAKLGSDWTFTCTDRYRITTDDAFDDPSIFASDDTEYPSPYDDADLNSIPQIGDERDAPALDPTTTLYLLSQNWVEDSDTVWILDAEYSSNANDPALWDPNPLNQTPVPQWGEETLRVALQADLDGEPFVNTAGDPFGATQLDDICPTITVTMNVATFSSADILYYAGTVNALSQWVYGAGQVWLKSHTASQQFRNGVLYYSRVSKFIIMGPLTQLFTARDDFPNGNWCTLMKLSEGLRYWDPSSGSAKPIPARPRPGHNGAAQDAQVVTKAVLLDEDGMYFQDQTPEPYFIPFRVKNLVDWTSLDLPDGL